MQLLPGYKFPILPLSIAVLFLVLTSWLIQSRLKANEQRKIEQSLNAVLSATRQAIISWSKEHKAELRTWASTPEINRITRQLLAIKHSREALNKSPAQAELRAWLRPFLAANNYLGYFIIGPGNINLASNHDQTVGKKNLLSRQETVLRRIWSGETVISLPERSSVPMPDKDGNLHARMPAMFVGGPILDAAGEVIAAFTFCLNPAEDFTAILRKGRLGPSSETYAFDSHGRLISESRFDNRLHELGLLAADEPSILNLEIRDPGVDLLHSTGHKISNSQPPLTRMAASAIAGESASDLEGYRDYLGVTVVGAWLWDEELGFGIATEIDKAEAFKTLNSTRYAISGFTAISILLLVFMMLVFMLDIFRRRRVEQLLREERDKAQGYLDTVEALIVALDENGAITLVNRKACELLGYTEEQLLGKNWFTTCLPQAQAEEVLGAFEQLTAGDLDAFEYYENPITTHSGRERLIAWHNSYLRDAEGNIIGTLSAGEDITLRRRAEDDARQRQAELAHVARFNTMGEMATGLAHELNQPLAAISTYAVAAIRTIQAGNKEPLMLNETLEAVITQAKRASEIISHLRSFVKKQPDQKKNINLNDLVRDIIDFVNADIHNQGVELQLELDESLPTVSVDGIQIEQVLLNLVRNALDAMQSQKDKPAMLLIRTSLNDAAMVQCEVTDNGPGIAPETLANIFESFVTTKGAKGLGMGLSISRSIIESHQGRLWAESQPGRGASFYFTLPTASSERPSSHNTKAPAGRPAKLSP